MTWKSVTLDDLKSHWQPVRSAILATVGFFVSVVVCCTRFKLPLLHIVVLNEQLSVQLRGIRRQSLRQSSRRPGALRASTYPVVPRHFVVSISASGRASCFRSGPGTPYLRVCRACASIEAGTACGGTGSGQVWVFSADCNHCSGH